MLQIPEVPSDATPTVYFVKLSLKDATGRLVSSNFYWLSTKKPEFDWEKTSLIHTPVTSYQDMTRLFKLPKTHLKATAHLRPAKNGASVEVRLKNTRWHSRCDLRSKRGSRVKKYCRYSGKIITSRCCPERNGLSRRVSPINTRLDRTRR